ncbi:hypothetical protein ACNPON_09445 [Glutamicibacter sp. AGC13]
MVATPLTWHWVFVVTDAVGIVWGLIWFFMYRNPVDSKRTNAAELQ